ncbi:MAG: hypothetical protein U0989_00155 [Azonexus sp.]|nr:hypothetical protein [Azonexus sp.]MDZ4313181.1 hypothetical protein [Azonexus sp.]
MRQRDNKKLLDEPAIEPPEQMQSFDKIPQEVIDLISKQNSISFVLADETDPSTQQICMTLTNLAQRAQDGAMTLSTVEIEAIQHVELILRSMIELMDGGGNATASELTEQIRLLASNKETSTEPELDQVLINVLAKDLQVGEMVDLKSCPFLRDHEYADDVYGLVKHVALETKDGKATVTITYDDFGTVHYLTDTELLVLAKN